MIRDKIAYLAGIIDGEGYNGIKSYPGKEIVPEALRIECYETIKTLNQRGPKSVEANTLDIDKLLMKIESELDRNIKSLVSDDRTAHIG